MIENNSCDNFRITDVLKNIRNHITQSGIEVGFFESNIYPYGIIRDEGKYLSMYDWIVDFSYTVEANMPQSYLRSKSWGVFFFIDAIKMNEEDVDRFLNAIDREQENINDKEQYMYYIDSVDLRSAYLEDRSEKTTIKITVYPRVRYY